jgi:hypothetical protein
MAPDPIRSDQRGLLDSAVHDTAAKLAQYHEVFDVIPCDDVLEDIIRRDQNLLGLFSKGSPEAALEYRWWGVSQIPQTLTVTNGARVTVAGTSDFDIPNAEKSRIPDNTAIAAGITAYLVDPEVPTETMKITNVSADDGGTAGAGFSKVTVTQAVTGARALHANGNWQIMDIPYPEASEPVIMRLNEPTYFKNTFQMFERWLELSRHQVKAKVKYVDDYFGWLVDQNS